VSDIVIIEEDRLMRGLLVEWLSAAGYSVRAAESGDARSMETARLVIVDVYMPRDHGAKRLHEVKANHPQTAVIAISAQFRPGLAGSCSAADALGVRKVIAKPCSRRDLLAAVEGVIGQAG
jgi:CheY-like chemotaxis protein